MPNCWVDRATLGLYFRLKVGSMLWGKWALQFNPLAEISAANSQKNSYNKKLLKINEWLSLEKVLITILFAHLQKKKVLLDSVLTYYTMIIHIIK